MYSIIVAIARNNAIGKNGKLLFYLPNDLKWFKKHTTGHTVIMGRKTYQSLPNGALPNRRNIVISKSLTTLPDAEVVSSLEQLEKIINPAEENFIIGGAQIYKFLLPATDKLYITQIHAEAPGADTFFPPIDYSQWELIEKIHNLPDEKNKYEHTFLIYKKLKNDKQ